MTARLSSRAAAVLTAAAVLVLAGAGSARAAEVRWETHFDAAKAAALESNQPVYLDFWAVWCEACGVMDQDVYSDEEVISAMKKVVPVRIDVDKETVLARKYHADAIPTLVIADAFGNELIRFTGTLSKAKVLEMLAAVPGDLSRINALAKQVAAGKDDFAALTALGREVRHDGFFIASNGYLGRALKTRDAKRDAAARAGILLDMARNDLALESPDQARRLLEQVIKEGADPATVATARSLLAR